MSKSKENKEASSVESNKKKSDGLKKGTRNKKEKPNVSDQQRYEMIKVAAYFIAERSGFVGDLHECWVQAEKQIDKMLGR